jgi:hypothetical protein
MRDKVPLKSETGTGKGDVVQKGQSAERRESPVPAGRLGVAITNTEARAIKHARGVALGTVRAAALALLLGASVAGAADRATEICRNPGDTREPLSVASAVTTLGPLRGFSRHKALRCLEPRIPASLSGIDLARIAGDGTDHRERMICSLRGHVQESIGAGEAAVALGALSGFPRYVALRCLEPRLASGLTEEEVNVIVGKGRTHRGAMIEAIDRKTVEGMNRATLREYMTRFPSRQFLGEGDPPGWFNGQCIAWARKLYAAVSKRSIESIAFGTARQIPATLKARGFQVVTDPLLPRVGAMVVWDEGAAGHVGVVTRVSRDRNTGAVTEIIVSEANFGRVTAAGAKKWGLTETEARAEFVTERYGVFDETRFAVSSLDRGLFKFVAYVYP